MARKLKSDKLLFTATLLAGVRQRRDGLQRVGRAGDGAVSPAPNLFLFKQATWALLGLALMPIVMRVDYRHYRQPVVHLDGARRVAALALVAVLFGPRINGARRWFGVAGIGVQPSELAKIAVVFFVAAILERRMDRIDDVRLLAAADRAGRRRRGRR